MSTFSSFKVKLVVWFALLALLPLAVAFYEYGRLEQRSEARRADTALEGDLRAALTGYTAQVDAATVEAEQLAAQTSLQSAIRAHNRRDLARALRGHPHAGVTAGAIHVGAHGGRSVSVIAGGRVVGRVSVAVPLDRAFLQRLSAVIPPGDMLRLRGTPVPRGYRTLSGGPFIALTPTRAIKATANRSLELLGTVLVALLVAMGIATYLVGSSTVVMPLRRLARAAQSLAQGDLDQRLPVQGRDEFARVAQAFNEMAFELEQERARTRAARARFGAALAATLEPAELLSIAVATAVEETNAAGGMIERPDDVIARVGRPEEGKERIAFPLRAGAVDFGSLVLTGDAFDADHVETAAALSAQVTIALENARLHGIVQRQALLDGLTGLANRRGVEEKLRAEVARARRFDDRVCLVLADLDDFKSVNDSFGHPAGDEALRLFAATLAATVREMDVAARWGGEEFALVLPGTDAEGGVRLAERARAALEQCTLRVDGREMRLTASFGVASLPPGDGIEDLVNAADAALYEAKRTGKNRVMV
ncbi:MAG TPA: diguanylate cyclase [Gaiellaceae bacterium]|nr:diguanylate cyclase [Gaiellaceae bacterium]